MFSSDSECAPTFALGCGDAVHWLRRLPDSSVDLIVTDPPYESLEKHRAVGTTTRLKNSKASSNKWFEIFPNDRFEELFTELYRILRKNRHFYLYCDAETMFVAKPIAERCGFRFWKPLVWDKCLGPDTLVWTTRGTARIADIEIGDHVAIPEGGTSRVRGVRKTRAPARLLRLSDGTELVASLDHKLVRSDGRQVEAGSLNPGERLAARPIKLPRRERLRLADVIPESEAIYELPDSEVWFPESLPLDYELGKLVGLFAAEGILHPAGVTFALHTEEKHLRHHIQRQARTLGVRATHHVRGNSCVASINFKIARYLIEHFVGGDGATTKYFREPVYAAPDEFRRGVLTGLLEGDGHWSNDEQRETLNVASIDLAAFAHRSLSRRGSGATMRRFENDHAGGWRVRHDPRPVERASGVVVEEIVELGVTELVDISIEHPDELFLLANGVVSHNCKIGMGYHYRARYELILFFEKGKRKLNDLGVPDIIEAPRIYRGYPAEKPVDVSRVLVTQSTNPEELVIDPFMGSGSVGVAAISENRRFLGNDLCDEAVDITRGRLVEAGGLEGKPEQNARPGAGAKQAAQLDMLS